jgi:hypothetical protein
MTPRARQEVSIHVSRISRYSTHGKRSDSILCQKHLGRSFERYFQHLKYAVFVKFALGIGIAAFLPKLFGLPGENHIATSLFEEEPEDGKTSSL